VAGLTTLSRWRQSSFEPSVQEAAMTDQEHIDTQGEQMAWRRRPPVKWSITILLGLLFLLVTGVYLLADLVSNDLLDPQLYTSALEEHRFYERIYTDLLADPAVTETTAAWLGSLDVDPTLADDLTSFATAVLRMVLPPSTMRDATESAIDATTAYFRGDTEELQPRLSPLATVEAEELADAIADRATAFLAEQSAEALAAVERRTATLDQEVLAGYLAQLDSGRIAAIPEEIAAVSLDSLTEEERAELVGALLGPRADTTPEATQLQIQAALQVGDWQSALFMAARVRLQARVREAGVAFREALQDNQALDLVTETARVLSRAESEILSLINRVRGWMIFLDGTVRPFALLVMALALGAIVWLHAEHLPEVLRASGVTLILVGVVILLTWLIVGRQLESSLQASFDASTQASPALISMVRDVVFTVTGSLWTSVWRSVLILSLVGVVLLGFSYLPYLTSFADRLLAPVWRYRKGILVGAALFLVVIPVLLQNVFRARREANLPCNGHVELCDRPLDEVAFAATHNSMSITEYNWIWPSHDGTLTNQLNAGVRALLIDTHYWDYEADIAEFLEQLPPDARAVAEQVLETRELAQREGLFLCHNQCFLGATVLEESLVEIREFLEAHPREVVVLIIQDAISPADTASAFEASGLVDLVYTHETGRPWPTLRELIARDERVVVTAEEEGPPPDWYLNVWEYTEETPYSFRSPDEFSCEPNRGETGKPFFLLNHWIERASPSRADAATINAYDFLLARTRQCAAQRGQIPNFVAINFYLNGDVFAVVDELNGVREAAAP
jgi:hypothetical protein